MIDGVRTEMEELRFNTAIAKLIELTNRVTQVASSARTPSAGRPARWWSRWC